MATEFEITVLQYLCTQKWFVNELYAFENRGRRLNNKWVEAIVEDKTNLKYAMGKNKLRAYLKVIFLLLDTDQLIKRSVAFLKLKSEKEKYLVSHPRVTSLEKEYFPWTSRAVIDEIESMKQELTNLHQYDPSVKDRIVGSLTYRALGIGYMLEQEEWENMYNLRELFDHQEE